MGNYKPWGHETITVGYTTINVPDSAIIMMLYDDTSGSGAPDSFSEMESINPWQVPSGKTFYLVGAKLWTTANGTMQIYIGNTADALSTLKLSFIYGGPGFAGNYEYYLGINNSETLVRFTEGKYIVLDPIGTTCEYITLIGYLITEDT